MSPRTGARSVFVLQASICGVAAIVNVLAATHTPPYLIAAIVFGVAAVVFLNLAWRS